MTSGSSHPRSQSLPLGVVLRRTPGVTRWARWAWKAVEVIPAAGPGRWKELRREGDTVCFHAATASLELHRAETEAYLVSLNAHPPSVYVILGPGRDALDRPELLTVTASAYEAQDYTDNAENQVEPVPIPPGLEAWIGAFVRAHHRAETFVKRTRRPHHEALNEDGIGDPRIRQTADVYRSPALLRRKVR